VVPVVRVPGEIVGELGRSLGVGDEVVGGFIEELNVINSVK
jgi:hypothetical protein